MRKLIFLLLLFITTNAYAVEDTSTFTLGGTDSGDLSATSTRITHTVLPANGDAFGYKDYGVDYFGEFEIKFHAKVNTQGSSSYVGYFALSNTPANTLTELAAANDGLTLHGKRENTDGWYFVDRFDDAQISFLENFDGFQDRYIKFTRVGTTCTMNLYDDSGFSNHILSSPKSFTCQTTKYRYLYAVLSGGTSRGTTSTASGYTENIDIVQADSGGSSPAGVTTTTLNKASLNKGSLN